MSDYINDLIAVKKWIGSKLSNVAKVNILHLSGLLLFWQLVYTVPIIILSIHPISLAGGIWWGVVFVISLIFSVKFQSYLKRKYNVR